MVWEVQTCTTAITIIAIIYAVLATALMCTVIVALSIIIAKRRQETMSELSQKVGIIFLIAIILTLLFGIIHFSGKCMSIQYEHYQIFISLYNAAFALQVVLLLIIFFDRIVAVFKKTPLRISNCIKWTYYGAFTSIPIVTIIIVPLYAVCTKNCRVYTYLVSILLLSYIFMILSMLILFIQRLIKVYKTENENEILVAAITKITILVSISVLMTFIDSITTSMYRRTDNQYILWIFNCIALSDVYTNFVCIILCFKAFNMYYSKICTCLDRKCRKCWTKIVEKDDNHTVVVMDNHKCDHQLTVTNTNNTQSDVAQSNASE